MTRYLPLYGLIGLLALALVTGLTIQARPAPAPDFSQFPAGEARKAAFLAFFVPVIRAENEAVLGSRQRLAAIVEAGEAGWLDGLWLDHLADRYELDEFERDDPAHWRQLLARVDRVPASMALAQAANESAWGTSRFARQGNNYFGQWCFTAGCGLVPAQRESGAGHEVAAFRHARESVRRYVNNINTHPAYADLRRRRAALRAEGQGITGLALAPALIRYSERGQAYVDELESMIRFNNLQQYDG